MEGSSVNISPAPRESSGEEIEKVRVDETETAEHAQGPSNRKELIRRPLDDITRVTVWPVTLHLMHFSQVNNHQLV